jgi:hypothetical protein
VEAPAEVLVRDGFVHAVGDGAVRESVPRGATLRETAVP